MLPREPFDVFRIRLITYQDVLAQVDNWTIRSFDGMTPSVVSGSVIGLNVGSRSTGRSQMQSKKVPLRVWIRLGAQSNG
jgi:hypothetical protein